ncbi:MAG: hypothetical protein HZA64_00345 [Rhodocyclales bacterium]|nr:hypothetical protein [Rhodocyclales bacterium]
MYKLLFEKVGDIRSTYAYLYVYLPGDSEPFMAIAVTDTRELEFTFFRHENNVVLTVQQLQEILTRARSFLPQALENEDNSGMP